MGGIYLNNLTEQQERFCELYADKEALKLTHELIAVELGVSTKTIQRWLKNQDIINQINRLCASKLDRMLPTLTENTVNLLKSKSSNDKIKGSENYWKLQDKLQKINEGSQLSREQQLVHEMGKLLVDMMKGILPVEVLCSIVVSVCWKYVVEKGYQQSMDKEEMEKFLKSIGID